MAQGLEENLLKLGLSTISSWVAQNAASVWYDVVRETLLWYSEPLVTEGGAAEVPVGFLEFRFDELRDKAKLPTLSTGCFDVKCPSCHHTRTGPMGTNTRT